MKLVFTPIAKAHWDYWKATNPKIAQRIKRLLADILEPDADPKYFLSPQAVAKLLSNS